MRAYRHAGADFTRPLGHTPKHDIHDPDAADNQRDASDGKQQSRHHVGGRSSNFRDLFLIAHREIVIAPQPNVMTLPQQIDDLLLRDCQVFRIRHLHIDVA